MPGEGAGLGVFSAVTGFGKFLSVLAGKSPGEKTAKFASTLVQAATAEAANRPGERPRLMFGGPRGPGTETIMGLTKDIRAGMRVVWEPIPGYRTAEQVATLARNLSEGPWFRRSTQPASLPRPPSAPAPTAPTWSPPIRSPSPTSPSVIYAQQPGAPTQWQLPTIDLGPLQRAFDLREALLMLRELFRKPKRVEPYYYPGYPQYPAPVPTSQGGVTVPSMIPFFGSSLMPGPSGAGLSGSWADILGQALQVGGGIAQQIVAQRPSQIPIPGPLGGFTLPGYVPEGTMQVPGIFQTRERAVAMPFQVTNPITGQLVYYASRGRPILFSGDFAACRRVQTVASRAARACGGRRRRGR